MGMGALERIAGDLMAGGRRADEPAAAVRCGTTPRQRVVTATLGTLAARCAEEGLGPPAVVVVGPVASMAEAGGAADPGPGPLEGRRVVVTRARAQASELSAALRGRGAEVVELPTIRVEPIPGGAAIDAACAAIGAFDLIVLTSVNGVDQLFARLGERGRDARALRADATVVAIGPATGARLEGHGVRADLVPARFTAEGILEALAGRDLAGRRALVARAEEARPDLVRGLRDLGADVDEVALYRTLIEAPGDDELRAARAADYVTFTSSSTVRNYVALVGPRHGDDGPRVVSIGPITSATARGAGLPVHAEAREHTIHGLLEALVADAAR
jgi:uroporphyrinogen III methyltransferase/synthase